MKTFTNRKKLYKYVFDNNLEITDTQWEIVEVRNTYTKESKWILRLRDNNEKNNMLK